jgi:predicted ATPase/class 3 adenylate cyclase
MRKGGDTTMRLMTVAQPAGTVTLVFTDIEGSTRLLEELGVDAYRDALSTHREIVRGSCSRHDGYEVDYEGDAFFYAFRSAQEAVSAVGEAMVGLDGGPIRIRVGVHTGEPALDPPKYVGLDVHRAARIMAAAHGGQVVLSPSTVALLEPGSVQLRDLGAHRLKDLSAPIPLQQLLVDGLPTDFPPLKTLYRSNLPVPATPFLGREEELAAVVGRLTAPDTRLLTLTGPGGTGKTRLSLQAAADAADQYPDGITWVPLAPLRDPGLVLSAVAQALGVRDLPGVPLGETLTGALEGKRALLLLDNLEHLLPEVAADVSGLLATCRSVRLMVTSRERLQLQGETVWPVPPLSESDGERLFTERARSLSPGFVSSAAVGELCRRLDELPLAIELAAARSVVFTPGQLLERFGQRLDLLKGGRDTDPRQQTLRATIEWSHDLLTVEERRLLRRLSVFAGGCSFDLAEQVCDADPDTLQSLLDKSLVRRRSDPDGQPRYWMLETVREYASEQLEADPYAEVTRSRQADWILSWATSFDVREGDQNVNLLHLLDELPNIRLALDELRHSNRGCDAMRLVADVAEGMFQLGAAAESSGWFVAVLPGSEACPPDLRARALAFASMQASFSGNGELGHRYGIDAFELAETCGDGLLRAEALRAQGVAEITLGNPVAAERLTAMSLSLAEELGNEPLIADLRNNLSYLALANGNLELARSISEQALSDARNREDHHLVACLLHNLFLVALESRDTTEATRCLEEALAISRRHQFDLITRVAIEGTAILAARESDLEIAALLLGAPSPAGTMAVEQELRRTTIDHVRSNLGDATFADRASAGGMLSLEEAAGRATQWLTRSSTP